MTLTGRLAAVSSSGERENILAAIVSLKIIF
jgi:hypothetical protein